MHLSDEMVRVAAEVAYLRNREGSKSFNEISPQHQSEWCEKVRPVLEAALAAMWRPIGEAKRDGTEYLCLIPGFGMGQMVLYWTDGYWREKANGMGLKREPTHFMPLPSPPPQQEEK